MKTKTTQKTLRQLAGKDGLILIKWRKEMAVRINPARPMLKNIEGSKPYIQVWALCIPRNNRKKPTLVTWGYETLKSSKLDILIKRELRSLRKKEVIDPREWDNLE